MEFFDCSVTYGPHTGGEVFRCAETAAELCQELRRAGVARAVVSRTEQRTSGLHMGNQLLADDIAGCDHLYGTWTLLPSHTREMPPPEELLPAMKRQRIIGWRLYPGPCRFLLKEFVLRDWLDLALTHHLPLFLNTEHGATLEQVADFLERVPELTLVLTYNNDWPSDRYLRPFVASFPNVYLDLKHMITDGGIESFVEAYGSSRLLYGSGYPDAYFGANMMMVRHAQLPEADRAAIAGGNLARLVGEVAL